MGHDKHIESASGLELLANVRKACAGLPEVEEKIDSFGHTSFRVKDKPFVMLGENEEGPSLAIKTNHETQEILLQQGRYYKTPYIGHHGWVSLRTGETVDWEEIGELIVEAYSRTAPKRLLRLLSER